jgi:putative FmdB family regulatory protein
MPIYEYICDDCREEFEVLVRGAEKPNCPSCGGGHLEKQWSVPAAHSGSSQDLPICNSPPRQTCGLPQAAWAAAR